MLHKVKSLQHLGLYPAESRTVTPMPHQLKLLVPKPKNKEVVIKSDTPDPERDTVPFIIERIKNTLSQTKKLAAKLKGSSLGQTLANDSNLVLNHILYRKDDPNHEEVRDPAATIWQGKGDCDCFVTLLGSILTNQKINFFPVTTSYPNQEGDGWSHTYIVVPKNQNAKALPQSRSDYVVLDPVTNRHDFEATPIKSKKYYTMSLKSLQGFSGFLSDCPAYETMTNTVKGPQTATRQFVLVSDVKEAGLVPTGEFLTDKNIDFKYVESAQSQTGKGYFIIPTPNGDLTAPGIITPADADAIVKKINSQPAPQPEPVAQRQAGMGIWAGLTLAVLALSVSAQRKPQFKELKGIPKKTLQVINI